MLYILKNFATIFIYSVLIGTAIGIACTLVFKNWRSLSHSAIHETFLLIVTAFLAYFISELLE